VTLPIMAWISEALISKLGVSLTVEFGSQLAEILRTIDEKTTQEYELAIRNQSINNLNQSKLYIRDILYITQDNLSKTLKKNMFYLLRQISSLSEKISYSGLIGNKINEDSKRKILYVNTLILSNTFSMLTELKKLIDEVYEEKLLDINTEKIRNIIREIENIIEIKNVIQNYGDRDIMVILSENNPELFVKIRALSGILYRMEEMKKPLLDKSKYYEKIQGYTLYLLDDVVKKRGPIVGLNHLYLDFIQEYPKIEINQIDFERSITNLIEKGMIEGISTKGQGYKVVKIKPLKLTNYYQEAIELVLLNMHLLETGLTKEDLSINLGYNIDLAEDILDEMAKEDIAWKHEDKYYFPGLAEQALKLKTKKLEVV
jgi:hypothetical protein